MIANEGVIGDFFDNIRVMFSTVRNNRIERSAVIDSLDNLTRAMSDDFIGSLEMLNDNPEVVKKLNLGLLPKLLGNKNNIDTLKKMYVFFKEVVNCFNGLKKDVYNALPPITTSKVVSIKAAVYLKIVDDLANMVSWYSSYTTIILLDKKRSTLPDVYFNKINEATLMFVNLYKNYDGKLQNILSDAKKLEIVNVDINDNNTGIVANSIMNSNNAALLTLNKQGFVGNPIFTLRIWIVELTVKLVDFLEYQNKIRQIAINKLKAELNGDLDPETREKYLKQIEKYEEMITKTLATIEWLKS